MQWRGCDGDLAKDGTGTDITADGLEMELGDEPLPEASEPRDF